MITLAVAFFTLLSWLVGLPIVLGLARLFGFYDQVFERTCHVYVLFGTVLGVVDEPGLVFPLARFGPRALLVRLFGQRHVLDLRIDQEYLRSQPVNSEEGAPMGIGVWYEMFVSDPVAFLFKNTDPRGSLRASVGSATVRALSNLSLHDLLTTRHAMSKLVRDEVSPQANAWGYKLGSVYVRKVHFRDAGMVQQIEQKVVNRLKQVTSAITQDGTNQVNLIRSAAERTAAVEFAKAAALRPQVVGGALREALDRPRVARSLFDILETQRLVDGKAEVVLVPSDGAGVLTALAATPQK